MSGDVCSASTVWMEFECAHGICRGVKHASEIALGAYSRGKVVFFLGRASLLICIISNKDYCCLADLECPVASHSNDTISDTVR